MTDDILANELSEVIGQAIFTSMEMTINMMKRLIEAFYEKGVFTLEDVERLSNQMKEDIENQASFWRKHD